MAVVQMDHIFQYITNFPFFKVCEKKGKCFFVSLCTTLPYMSWIAQLVRALTRKAKGPGLSPSTGENFSPKTEQ